MMNWCVYMILCSDDSIYTGISTDVERRFEQHSNKTGARYFRGRSPRKLIYVENGHDRSSASVREAAIKRLSHSDKQQLISAPTNQIA